jgi:hypothetical protein
MGMVDGESQVVVHKMTWVAVQMATRRPTKRGELPANTE